jgi:hypothetical protein
LNLCCDDTSAFFFVQIFLFLFIWRSLQKASQIVAPDIF